MKLDIKYTRGDVNYDTWYTEYMKQLAKNYTAEELEKMYYKAKGDAKRGSLTHLRAIEKTHSMTSNSQARAQAGNVVKAASEQATAIIGAIEIHYLFPEMGKQEAK